MLCTQRLAEQAYRHGDLENAEELWRETIAAGEVYLKQQPGNSDARSNVCWSCANLADAVLLPGGARAWEAERVLRQGLGHTTIALASNPRSSQSREVQAFLKCRLAQCYCWTDRADQSAALFREAVEELQSLCAEFPWNVSYWSNLSHLREATVSTLRAVERHEETETALTHMIAWSDRVANRIPEEPAPRELFKQSQQSLATLLRSAGREDEAAQLERSLAAEQ
jgi:hypothetical protein